jgi:hypothetical protein
VEENYLQGGRELSSGGKRSFMRALYINWYMYVAGYSNIPGGDKGGYGWNMERVGGN